MRGHKPSRVTTGLSTERYVNKWISWECLSHLRIYIYTITTPPPGFHPFQLACNSQITVHLLFVSITKLAFPNGIECGGECHNTKDNHFVYEGFCYITPIVVVDHTNMPLWVGVDSS